MADNLEENPLNDSTSNPSDSACHKTVSSIETNAHQQNQDTKNMEIHQHAHHEHGKRNWKSYFWEFTMLFLAVICAYLAESYHTHSVNKDIEKRNIEMVVDNLKKDVEQLNRVTKANEQVLLVIDSILSFQGLQNTDTLFSPKFANLLIKALPVQNFYSYSAAVDQMKSSGSLRLIKNKNVLEDIHIYEHLNSLINYNNEAQSHYSRSILGSLGSFYIIDPNTPTPQVLAIQKKRIKSESEDIHIREDIFMFFNHIRSKKILLQSLYIPQLKKQLKNAEALIQLLEKEYDLKKE